jgi:hypothetical protein
MVIGLSQLASPALHHHGHLLLVGGREQQSVEARALDGELEFGGPGDLHVAPTALPEKSKRPIGPMLPFSVSIAPSAVSKGQMWMGNQRREVAMFETTLAASRPQRDGTRRLAALPAAVAVHALALGVISVGQLWAVDPVRDVVLVPPLVVHLPLPLGGDSPARWNAGGSPVRVRQQRVAQPVVVPWRLRAPRITASSMWSSRTEGLRWPGTGPASRRVRGIGLMTVSPGTYAGGGRQPRSYLAPGARYPRSPAARSSTVPLKPPSIRRAPSHTAHDIGVRAVALDAIRGWRTRDVVQAGYVYLEVRVSSVPAAG